MLVRCLVVLRINAIMLLVRVLLMDYLTLKDTIPFVAVGETLVIGLIVEPIMEAIRLLAEVALILFILTLIKYLLTRFGLQRKIEEMFVVVSDALSTRQEEISARASPSLVALRSTSSFGSNDGLRHVLRRASTAPTLSVGADAGCGAPPILKSSSTSARIKAARMKAVSARNLVADEEEGHDLVANEAAPSPEEGGANQQQRHRVRVRRRKPQASDEPPEQIDFATSAVPSPNEPPLVKSTSGKSPKRLSQLGVGRFSSFYSLNDVE